MEVDAPVAAPVTNGTFPYPLLLPINRSRGKLTSTSSLFCVFSNRQAKGRGRRGNLQASQARRPVCLVHRCHRCRRCFLRWKPPSHDSLDRKPLVERRPGLASV